MTFDEIVFRPFLEADHSAAAELWFSSEGIELSEGDSREEIAGYLARNPGLSRVADAQGRIIGAVLCGHDGRRGLIYHLAVAPGFQGRGVGRRLLRECLDGLRATGIPRAILLVSNDNPTGRNFWRAMGFEEISEAMPMAIDVR